VNYNAHQPNNSIVYIAQGDVIEQFRNWIYRQWLIINDAKTSIDDFGMIVHGNDVSLIVLCNDVIPHLNLEKQRILNAYII